MNRRRFISQSFCGTAATLASSSLAASGQGQVVAIRPLAPKEGLILVAVPISKNTTEIDWVGPEAVFETWQRDPATKRPAKKFEIVTVAETRDAVGARIPQFTFDTLPAPRVVVVPAQNGSPALIEWLKRVAPTTDVTMSVCTGAHLLASAGLLNGLRATTHHESIDAFEKEFPQVTWIRDVRFVENATISTAAGLTSGIDLALHVVERYFGRDAAQGVADHVEHEGTRWITG
jgi:transcriptional regulator GlxA family with amidase domain